MALFTFVIGETEAEKAERLRQEEEERKQRQLRLRDEFLLTGFDITDRPIESPVPNSPEFRGEPVFGEGNRKNQLMNLADTFAESSPGIIADTLPFINQQRDIATDIDLAGEVAEPKLDLLRQKGLVDDRIFSDLQSTNPDIKRRAAEEIVASFDQFIGSTSKSLGTQFGQATGVRQAIPGLEGATDFDALIAGTIKEKNEISQGTLGQRLAEEAIFAHQRHRIAAQYATATGSRGSGSSGQNVDGIRSFNRTMFKEKQTEIDSVIGDNAKIAQDIKDIINNNTELYAWSVPEKFTTKTTGENVEISPLQILTTVKDIDPKQSSAVVRTYFEANDIDPESVTDKQMDRLNDAIGMYNKMLESPISRGDANDALQLGTLQQKFLSNRLAIGELQRQQRDIQTIQVEGFTTINPSTGEQMYVPPDETIFSLAGGQTLSGRPTGTLLTSPRNVLAREAELPGIKPVSPIERKPESTAPTTTQPLQVPQSTAPFSERSVREAPPDPLRSAIGRVLDLLGKPAPTVQQQIESSGKPIGDLPQPSREAEANKEAIRQTITAEVSRLQTMTPEQLVSNPNTRGLGTADSVVKTAERLIKQKGGNPDDYKKELQDLADEVIRARTKMGLR